MNKNGDTEIFSERELMFRQLRINEEQLTKLHDIKAKESFKATYSYISMCLSGIGLLFFLFVIIHPSGSLFINSSISQFSGILCVFLGYAFYRSGANFCDHRTILKQVIEYVYEQREAIDSARNSLANNTENSK